jgi:signal transduction histidine kinase
MNVTDLAVELRAVPVLADVPEEALAWLADHMEIVEVEKGQNVSEPGAPADRMFICLEGELFVKRETGPDKGRTFVWRQGQVTGALPYSRLQTFPVAVRAEAHSRVAILRKEWFPEMLEKFPILGARFVAVMADRIRDNSRAEAHSEKLALLGKISAGLAHELNNPAAAARRAAEGLRESVKSFRRANACLDRLPLTPAQRAALAEMEERCLSANPTTGEVDPLELSDREQALGEWMEAHGMSDAWTIPAPLAQAGADVAKVEKLANLFPPEALGDILRRIAATLLIGRLVDEVENSTGRISDLVKAVKEYSFLDRGPEQEIDVHDGLESTLLMLRHKLKRGISVVREYDRSLPKICARGGELNQVWTNLIVNAIEAMGEAGQLRIRTSLDGARLLVEIIDNGPGIPPEVQEHLFEPFFTTKTSGDGTGLGLETSDRIVRTHRGEIRYETRPGRTNFQVRLPLQPARQAT